jgi:Squalene-hopene cyclase C-terminal domain
MSQLLMSRILAATIGLVVASCCFTGLAEETGSDYAALRDRMIRDGVAYLTDIGQASDGSYSSATGLGVTAIATTALLRNGVEPDDPRVAKSLEYLLSSVQPDGGIYRPGSFLRNYETSTAIMAISEANRGGRYDKVIQRAGQFLRGIQWDEDEGKSKDDLSYGGAGYGKHKRPDLSNTSFLVDALKSCGAGPDDPAMQKALTFISRCQNLESSANTSKFSVKNPDGGFYYTCAAGGQSKAGETTDGGLRSYGSMTYAGLKSMIYAGLGPDDSRVRAATDWIKKNYGLSTNPGLGEQGLFYYYHTFAKALAATGTKQFVDSSGKSHNWRAELVHHLAERQQPGRFWVNEKSDRWLEGDPNLVTAYALLALSYCRE